MSIVVDLGRSAAVLRELVLQLLLLLMLLPSMLLRLKVLKSGLDGLGLKMNDSCEARF